MNNKNHRLQQAYQLHEAGKLEEAKSLYQKLLAENPEQVEALHGLAVLLAQSKHYSQALELLDKATTVNIKLPSLYNSKGNIYLRLGQYDKAISEYKTAIAYDHKYAIAYNNLGNAYDRKSLLDLSRNFYEQAITLSDHYADAHFNLGVLLAKLGENETAITHLKKSIALEPHRAAAYGQLAELYLHLQDFNKAIEYYLKRLDYEPKHVASYFSLGQAYLQNKNIEEAIAAFKKVLILDPQHDECNHFLGNAVLAKGDTSMALNYYLRQITRQPILESYYNVGVLLMQQNRLKESTQYFTEALTLDPGYLPTYLNLGAIYLKLNRIDEAIKQYQTALEIQPNDPEIQHILSALSKTNTPDQAPSEYLSHLFDHYARYYDQHLTEHLQYKAHALLFQAIQEESDVQGAEWTVLDLGCGTGLCGELLKPIAKTLIGVDISEKMLSVAKSKHLYDILQHQEIMEALDQYTDNHLIVAGDVFSYIGKLDTLFSKAFKALKPNGLFVFTVEKTYTEPYELQKTIRYAHSKRYLEDLARNTSFSWRRCNNIVLRKQHNNPVEGYLVVLVKENQPVGDSSPSKSFNRHS